MANSFRVPPSDRAANAINQIRQEALESTSVELRRDIRSSAYAIAGKMVRLHGAECHVQIEDDFAFVLVLRDLAGID